MDTDEVLSEAEVDALMDSADGGDGRLSDSLAGIQGEVVEYDFAGQDHIVRGRMPVLERVNERLAQHFQQGLYNTLQRTAEISPAPLRTVKFAEFINSLEVPASLNCVTVKQLQGTSLLVLEARLVGTLVDLYFGGSGHCEEVMKDHEFTVTEQRIIQLLLEQLVHDMQAAWAPVMSIDFENLQAGIDLQFTNIAGAMEPLVVCSFDVELEGNTGALHVAFPLSMLGPVSDLLDGGVHKDKTGSKQQQLHELKKNIQQASVEMHATLFETELKLREVLDLKAGDVIPVEIPEQLTLLAEGVPMFLGRFGTHNGKNSVKVTTRISDSDNSQGNKQ